MSSLKFAQQENPGLHQFNSNEISIIAMGDNPEEFDHFVISEIEALA